MRTDSFPKRQASRTICTGKQDKCDGPTILLVEDEDFVRQATEEILSCNGYRVLKARTSAEAIELFGKHRREISLLLSDFILPGQNGHRLAVYLNDLQPGFKTLFMSGYPTQAWGNCSILELKACYVPKPFSFELLLSKIQELLGADSARSKP